MKQQKQLLASCLLFAVTMLLAACGGGGSTPEASDNVNEPETGRDTGSPSGDGSMPAVFEKCPALPPGDTGSVITVSPDDVANLPAIVAALGTGDTIQFTSGVYDLQGNGLWIETPGITLRSATGNRDDVIIDGNGLIPSIISITASDVTVADLTLSNARYPGIHVIGGRNTRIYNIHVIDAGEVAIKVDPAALGGYADDGELACSHIELTDSGRNQLQNNGQSTGGFEGRQARGWVIRDNRIEGFWNETGVLLPAVLCREGCRDTIVERNFLSNNARGVMFGLSNNGSSRSYGDSPCPEAGSSHVEHYDGIVRNNFIFANAPDFLASNTGFDCGICFFSACGAMAVHNTVVSTGDNFSSIEWRFSASTGIGIFNNIVSHPMLEREGASADIRGNLAGASLDLFVDGANGDLHLDGAASTAIDQGIALPDDWVKYDFDGELRDELPDAGADEHL